MGEDRARRWALPPLRRGRPADEGLLARRAAVAAPAQGAPASADEVTIGGVRCLVLTPESGHGAATPTLLYFHGGGYRMGSPLAWAAYAGRLADAAGARLVLPFYRLAPEHPFPAALHDAAAVYRALRADRPVLLGGDSAGGGLAAALCIAAVHAGEPAAGAILVSPMLDLTARDATYDDNAASDTLFSRAAVLDAAELYLQGHRADDPLVSPLLADPALFPPLLLLAGGAEVLLGEALALVRSVALAGGSVTLHIAGGMGHVWPMMAPAAAETAAALDAMAGFVAAVMSKEKHRPAE